MELGFKNGNLTIEGQISGEEEEQQLLAAARERFGKDRVQAQLVYSATLPGGWLNANLQLLEYLGEMRSGWVSIKNERMLIEGIVADNERRYELARAIYMRWPPPFNVKVRLLLPLTGDAASCQKKILTILGEEPIVFQPDSAKLEPQSMSSLKKIAQVLTAFPETSLLIGVHTDNEKDPDINLIVTRARALAVREFLSQRGVGENRLYAEGFGDTRPLAPNDTARGRELNRRIEFIVLEN